MSASHNITLHISQYSTYIYGYENNGSDTYVCLHSILEDEGEASYPDSGLVTDSREGGPEESVSELEDGVDSTGGDAAGKPLSRHLGQEMGCLSGGLLPVDGGLDSYFAF